MSIIGGLFAAFFTRLPVSPRQVDWLVVASGEDEQIAALPGTLERFLPENLLWAGPHGASRSARSLQAVLAKAGLSPITAETGQALDLGEGARLRVLAVTGRGAVLLLEWNSFHALLPIGLDFETLLLAKSGYAPANPPGWIEWLRPQVALLSVAADDRGGRTPRCSRRWKVIPFYGRTGTDGSRWRGWGWRWRGGRCSF